MKRTWYNTLSNWLHGLSWRYTMWRAVRTRDAARARERRARGLL